MKALALLLSLALVTSCETSRSKNQTVRIFAASSLTDAFRALASNFEKESPNSQVLFNFAGSQSLRTQIEHGAQADVFASANPKHMSALARQKLVGESRVFAHNEMVLVVPQGNPARIGQLADLAGRVRLVLAGASVPAGAYANEIIARASAELGPGYADRVFKNVVSRELDARQTLQKVALGEAEAALVYATDAAASADKVQTLAIPRAYNVVASYPVALVHAGANRALGQAFIEQLKTRHARKTLRAHGFKSER